MRRLPLSLLPFLAVLALGCGSDTGPSGSTSVTGSWDLNVTNLTAGGNVCSLAGMIMTVTQNGGAFSGNYGAGVLTCTGSGSTVVSGGAVKNGTVTGTAIAFDLDNGDFHLAGTFTGTAMSGNATLLLHDSAGDYTATGSFSATRHN